MGDDGLLLGRNTPSMRKASCLTSTEENW